MKKTVTGMFDTTTAANRAMRDLLAADFDRDDVSLLMSKKTRRVYYPDSAAPEGLALGAGVGAIVGGLIGVAAAPPVGLVAAGPIAGLFGGAAVGAAGGGLLGTLVGLGIPEERARIYEDRIAAGEILVAVEAKSEVALERARKILIAAADRTEPAQNVVVTQRPQA